MKLIETKKMSKSYFIGDKETEILHSINLVFKENEFCGIVGPSGSGKTTLLYTLSGLERPTKGNVFLLGKNLNDLTLPELLKIRSSDIAFIFQFYNLLPNLTVYENIYIAQMFSENNDKEDILNLLKSVGMSDYIDYYPSQLSGGMQQRVAIARSLVNKPKILFADEPTGNLDIKTGNEVMNLLKKIQKDRKITGIMVTHNPDYLVYCTRKISLSDGRVDQDEELKV